MKGCMECLAAFIYSRFLALVVMTIIAVLCKYNFLRFIYFMKLIIYVLFYSALYIFVFTLILHIFWNCLHLVIT